MPPHASKYANLYFENKNKLHLNVKQCMWLNSPLEVYILHTKEDLQCFQIINRSNGNG